MKTTKIVPMYRGRGKYHIYARVVGEPGQHLDDVWMVCATEAMSLLEMVSVVSRQNMDLNRSGIAMSRKITSGQTPRKMRHVGWKAIVFSPVVISAFKPKLPDHVEICRFL